MSPKEKAEEIIKDFTEATGLYLAGQKAAILHVKRTIITISSLEDSVWSSNMTSFYTQVLDILEDNA